MKQLRVSGRVTCRDFPCLDVDRARFVVPSVAVDPAAVSVVLISEAAPADQAAWYEAGPEALFARTTIEAFRDAGEEVSTLDEVHRLGVYVTSAVKCAKVHYLISSATVERCSLLLERELALFPNVRAMLLMGDVAIKAVNAIARRDGEPRVVPAGSIYRLRGGDFRFRGARVFPSYLQAGPAFYIERSKRAMIAQDIAAALGHARRGHA